MLALVLIFAGFSRFGGLERSPPGFFRDEAEKGYNAWALATTGGMLDIPNDPARPRMLWRRLPWMTDVFGNRTSGIYHYASVPFMWAGEPTVATTRMAAAAAGTLTVLLLGLLLMRAWGRSAGLVAALWLTICPWHLVFSRWALEGIFVPLLMAVTLWGLWGAEKERRWGWPVAGAGLGWLFYCYSGAQPLALAWGICLAAIYRRQFLTRAAMRSPWVWLGVAMFLLPVVPTLLVRLEPGGSERMGRIAIWNDPDIAAWQVPLVFIKNYLMHFNPRFLFWAGDAQPRHCIPGFGQLVLLDAILVPAGVFLCFRRRRALTGALLAAWLCGPIPAALSNEGLPHGLRAIGMLLPSVAWSAASLAVWMDWIIRKLDKRISSESERTRGALLYGFTLFMLIMSMRGINEYKRRYDGSRREFMLRAYPSIPIAFEDGQRDAWERIARERQPDQRVFVNGYQPFSVYYQLFFTRTPADAVGPAGPDPAHFIYYDPSAQTLGQLRVSMQPGDWLLYPVDPAGMVAENGRPWISAEEARRAGEPWVVVEKMPRE
jgi:hypothetical protein